MNLWDYDSCNVKIRDIDDNTYYGCIIVVNSADDLDSDEDELTLETAEGKFFGIKESDIKSIEVIN